MHRGAASALLLLLLGWLAVAADHYEGFQVLRLRVPAVQREWLSAQRENPALDFWTEEEVMVGPQRRDAFLDALARRGIAWEVLVPDVQTTVDAERRRQAAPRAPTAGRLSFDAYLRYEEMQSYLQQLARDFPDVVTLGSIGQSYHKRDLSYVRVSSGGNGSRPVILVEGGIHAREWIAPAMVLYVIQQLVENPSNADLIANVDWHLIPVLNPDGYEYSHTHERLWRKTRSITQHCYSGLDVSDRYQGVDANRNFDIHWNEPGNSPVCFLTYPGTKAFSEPETAALRDHVLAHVDNIKLYVAFHSKGEYILCPWGYTKDEYPEDYSALKSLGDAANAAQKAAGGNSYTVGTAGKNLAVTSGGSDDWVYGVAGVKYSYTVELPGGGSSGYDLPAEDIFRTVATFWPAVRVFGEHIDSLATQQ